jgi:hypothetical protein
MLQVLARYFPGGIEENHDIADMQAEILLLTSPQKHPQTRHPCVPGAPRTHSPVVTSDISKINTKWSLQGSNSVCKQTCRENILS